MSGRVATYLRQNVLGLVAIFLALTAGAYAVQKAPKNSVVSKSIKDGQVQNADLGAGAVTADKLGAGSVTAEKLGAGAVTSAALADGVVSLGKLGFDAATQAELDATTSSLSSLSAPGTINGAGNPVDWTKLKGVPDGFADGIDRVFGLAATDSSGDTTPSVASLSVLSVNAPAPLTITDLEDAAPGQVLTIHQLGSSQPITINDGGAVFVLNSNWISNAGDTLTLARVPAGFWVEVARSAN